MGKKIMPLATHLRLADDLAVAYVHLQEAHKKLTKYYSNSNPVMDQFYRILPGLIGGAWSKIKSRLDDDYHALITDDEFKTHGHIYYSLEKRYENMKSEIQNRGNDK